MHGKAANVNSIWRAIDGLPGAEVHGGTNLGKLVVTLETVTEGDLLERIDTINHLQGVLSVALVFHHVEDERRQD